MDTSDYCNMVTLEGFDFWPKLGFIGTLISAGTTIASLAISGSQRKKEAAIAERNLKGQEKLIALQSALYEKQAKTEKEKILYISAASLLAVAIIAKLKGKKNVKSRG